MRAGVNESNSSGVSVRAKGLSSPYASGLTASSARNATFSRSTAIFAALRCKIREVESSGKDGCSIISCMIGSRNPSLSLRLESVTEV